MFKKAVLALFLCLALDACASDKPRVIQASNDMTAIHLTSGMATQVEIPNGRHVRSVVVGNPSLVTADHDSDVVSLVPKEGTGETNLIVRAADDSGEVQVYQYKVIVQGR